MSLPSTLGITTPQHLYPVVHDLTEVEYSNCPQSSPLCCDGTLMGSLSFYDLVRPPSPHVQEVKKVSSAQKASSRKHIGSSSSVQSDSASGTFESSSTGHTLTSQSTMEAAASFDDVFVLTRPIYRCNVSSIWECVHREHGTRHCVKVIDRRRFSNASDEDAAYNELSVLTTVQTLSYSRLPRLIQWTEELHKLYLVQEYVEGGNLATIAREEDLSEGEIRLITRSILLGLQELHEFGIGHFHLQPDNILLHANHQDVVICDFGCASKVADDGFPKQKSGRGRRRPKYGSLLYAAPELCQEFPEYGLPADLWSLGVCLYELFTDSVPFRDVSRRALKERILEARYSLTGPKWKEVSRSAKQFISALLHPDPQIRMTVKEALSHPWILCPPPSALLSLDPQRASVRFSDGILSSQPNSFTSASSSKMISKTMRSKFRSMVKQTRKGFALCVQGTWLSRKSRTKPGQGVGISPLSSKTAANSDGNSRRSRWTGWYSKHRSQYRRHGSSITRQRE